MLRVLKKNGIIYISDLRRDIPNYLLQIVIPPNTVLKKLIYYSARAAYTKDEMRGFVKSSGGQCIALSTRKVTKGIAARYRDKGVSRSSLREVFQSRYFCVIKK